MEEKKEYQALLNIGTVAESLGISEQMVRLYEEKGLILPERTDTNRRMYSLHDLERLECIRQMIEQHGLTLNGIRRVLSFLPCWEYQGGADTDCEECPAYHTIDGPCWSTQPQGEKCAIQNCRECDVYQLPVQCNTLKDIIFLREPFLTKISKEME